MIGMAQMLALASRGPSALAPAALGAMPGAARILIVQRHAAALTKAAAGLTAGCGDALARCVAGMADADPATLAGMDHAIAALAPLCAALAAVPTAPTLADLATAYGQPAPADAPATPLSVGEG